MADPATANKMERAIINEFQEKRAQLSQAFNKVAELKNESLEHELVIKTLEPMEADRKCFRLIGDVLVERTVGETLPAVKKNKDNIDQAVSALQNMVMRQKKELDDFQAKYKIRIRNDGQDDDDDGPSSSTGSKKGAAPAKGSGQGVLVSSK